jgi:hypothetical protein
LVAGAKGLRLASRGSLSSGGDASSGGTGSTTPAPSLKILQGSRRDVAKEACYACGAAMVEMQACKFRCTECGALLDCEDVSGLPR